MGKSKKIKKANFLFFDFLGILKNVKIMANKLINIYMNFIMGDNANKLPNTK